MLNQLIKFSLKNKYVVLFSSVFLIILGTRTAINMDVDVFPDLTAPTVVVMTDAHGMASEEVERLVTYPIETAVNGATDVRRVRSASSQGYSFVWVEFDWGTDIYKARQNYRIRSPPHYQFRRLPEQDSCMYWYSYQN